MRNNFRQTFENTFAATAFAEAGEHGTAIKIAGVTDTAKTAIARFVRFVESNMTAVAFAEADCHEVAGRCVPTGEKRVRRATRPTGDTLDNFLENVGLKNVQVCYGLATVEG
ncbi:MAG: hypothetical protein ACQERN_09290 [Thermodesulfobacteriota bacterium]